VQSNALELSSVDYKRLSIHISYTTLVLGFAIPKKCWNQSGKTEEQFSSIQSTSPRTIETRVAHQSESEPFFDH
jgi:hypothetical protein